MSRPNQSGHAPVNGISMYYEIYGDSGVPLVLIHGGGSTIDTNFGHILPMLAASRKVIAVELQAHGRATDRDAPETFEQDADDVAALLRRLGVAKADILGFSNGGTTTMLLAARHAALVNKIIVVSANYRRDGLMSILFDGLAHATLYHMPQALKDGFLAVTPDEDKLRTMFEKDKARMLNFTDYSDELVASISAPTLLMVGDKDMITTEHVLRLSQLIPNARMAVIPGTHGSFLGEVCAIIPGSRLPEMMVIMINEFLDDTW